MADIYYTDGRIVKQTDLSLTVMQEIVGGYIEIVTLADNSCMVINEEGKFMDLPPNDIATRLLHSSGGATWDIVVGNAIVCKQDELK